MIEIGILPDPRIAQAFIDYLKGKGVTCQQQSELHGVKLFITQPADEQFVREEFQHFIQNPYAEKYRQASWDNGSSQIKFDYGSGGLGLLQQFITGAGPLTLVIFFVCTIVYAAMNLGFHDTVFNYLSFFSASPGSQLSHIWRLFTPSLMHFSILHVTFNLLWWWYLGGKIENQIGTKPLLMLLLVGGTLPSVVQFMMTGPYFGGLSGVVYAVVGYTWLMGRRQPQSGIMLPDSYMAFMMIWLVLGFTDLLGMPIANGAHMGGLVVGLTQALFDSRHAHKQN
ncbi:rhomboid family intramembrane serine protease GlpG [Shewanella maritima]|uniref:rhomboid family intramembrane serine protease GlpG n=1 Tax=Shewanella maritima TaxID=2520507 RepID=UPI00373662F1